MSYATLKCRRHGYGGDPRWLAPPTKRTGHVLTAEVQIEGQEGKEQHSKSDPIYKPCIAIKLLMPQITSHKNAKPSNSCANLLLHFREAVIMHQWETETGFMVPGSQRVFIFA